MYKTRIKNITLIITCLLLFKTTYSQDKELTLEDGNQKTISLKYNFAVMQIKYWNDLDNGIKLCENLIDEIIEDKNVNYNNLVKVYLLYSYGLQGKGDFDKAIELNLDIISLCNEKSIYPESCITGLTNLGHLYSTKNNFSKALLYNLEAVRMSDTLPNLRRDLRSMTLNNLAGIYDEIGQIDKALNFYNKSYAVSSNDSVLIDTKGFVLNNLSFIHRRVGNYDMALKLAKESLLFFEEVFGTDNIHYGVSLNNMAISYEYVKDYDNALLFYSKSIDNIVDSYGKSSLEYSKTLHNVAMLNEKLGKTELALAQYQEAQEIVRNLIGIDNLVYKNIVNSLSNLYNSTGEFNKSFNLLVEKNKITHEQISQNFLYQTSKEKQDFIANTIGNEGLNHFANFNYLSDYSNKKAITLALNNVLTSKGLVLNSIKDIFADLKDLGNSALNDSVNKFIDQRSFITKQLQLPIKQRSDSLLKVKEANTLLERVLVNSYIENFNTDIHYIKDYKNTKLNKNEIAVEFTHFELFDKKWTDRVIYVAYIYKKGWKNPKAINLFEERELKEYFEIYSPRGAISVSIGNNEKVTISELLYKLIWAPIEPYLKNVETIYYSPDGLLHKVPINALPTGEGKFLGEIYDLSRVSNTSFVNTKEVMPNLDSSILIGDIDYDYTPNSFDLINESETHNILNSKNILKNDEGKRRNTTTGSWNYLPGTKEEIEFIQSLLPKSNVLRKKQATETNFKKLSGKSPSIIHISTHGFFFPDPETKNNKNGQIQSAGYVLSEDPMLRSGLIFANANYAWQNGYNPYEEDDGILTALDISNLDLRKTDIVILSACDTGLGDIPSSEGVFGLQRAFKMAGVNTIIMTLWEVPDKETAEFMNVFYKKWKSSNDVNYAFKQAQNFMMKKYRYQPDKWAAFVLFE